MPRFTSSPDWIRGLKTRLSAQEDADNTGADSVILRAMIVREQGPSLLRALGLKACAAARELGFQSNVGPNWFWVQKSELPLRRLQCTLDIQQMGLGVIYTLGSLTHGGQPRETKDFVDLRAIDNNLMMSYTGKQLGPDDILEILFTNAFDPNALAPKSRPPADKKRMLKELLEGLI